jgi:hypothetical protein
MNSVIAKPAGIAFMDPDIRQDDGFGPRGFSIKQSLATPKFPSFYRF